MIPETLVAISLMVVLGVRHGIDPEHLAIINSVTLRAVESGRRWPSASGLWFALGHGLVITLMAAAFVGLLDLARLPAWARALMTWLPTAILFAVAVANLRELMRITRDYEPVTVKRKLLPRALRDSSSPPLVCLIGMLFAPFVDPASQAAVWGYVAGTSAGIVWVILLGALLTLSLAATCVLEAHAVVRMLHAHEARAQKRRRIVGWLIVWFSFLMVGYTLAATLLPAPVGWQWRLLTAAATTPLLCGVSAVLLRAMESAPRRQTSFSSAIKSAESWLHSA